MLFTIGPLKITCFGVMAACGFLSASILLFVNRKSRDISADAINDLTLYSIVAGILGARIFYVIQFWPEYRNNYFQIFRIDQGGLVFYGGFFAALATLYIYCKKKNISFLGVIDLVAPCLAIGHAFGRIGCFLNGCCYGRPTTLPWGVEFPQESFPFQAYPFEKLHPTQLYESAFNFLLAIALVIILRKSKTKGITAATYLITYGTGRFIIEMFRGDNARFMNLITISQFIGIILIAAGIYTFFISRKLNESVKEPDAK